ncbi:MAG: DUF2630 family protein [Acidimicrobiaceae bacterium]|nr:DUF2630 family protein [Acidimicrobiaceae bacterium]
MDDTEIVKRIDQLVDEEHRLERGHTDEGLSDSDRDRLASVQTQLDQCWDLLRQRRARRDAGQDPADTAVRPGSVVEHYQQ